MDKSVAAAAHWIAAVVISFAVSEDLHACSCGQRPSLVEARASGAIFDGTVISARPFLHADEQFQYSIVLEEWTFQVHRSWSQSIRERVVVVALPDNCGIWFRVGERAIVVGSPLADPSKRAAFWCGYPLETLSTTNVERLLGAPVWVGARALEDRRIVGMQNAVRRVVLQRVADVRNRYRRSELRGRGFAPVLAWGAAVMALAATLLLLLASHVRAR